MRVIVKKVVDDVGSVKDISGGFEEIQEIVGGYVAPKYFCKDGKPYFCVLCDEDGFLKQLDLNCGIMCGDAFQWFVGDIVAVGIGDDDFTDLPEEIDLAEWRRMLIDGFSLEWMIRQKMMYERRLLSDDEEEEDEDDQD